MKVLSVILAKAGLIVDGLVTLNNVPAATTDTDKFIVVDSGVVKYRTGSQLLSDIGGISGNQSITLTGDATGSGTTSIAVTLANSGVIAGTYGSSTAVPVITVDAKGRVTGVTTASISGSLTFTGDVTGSGTTGSSTTLTLANSGVTAGTYQAVTVDAKGRVTSGSNPTTLSGYGITDAVPSSRTITINGTAQDLSANRSFTVGDVRTDSTYANPAWITSLAWSKITGTPTTLSGYGITDAQPLDADLTAIAALTGTSGFLKKTAANTWSLDTNTYLTGNQTITLSGDASGSGATAITVTLANSGVTAGTYTKVTVDAKGRVTVGASLAVGDLPSHTHDDRYYTETEVDNFFSGTTAISGYNKSNWDTAFGWGNHGTQGYATTSYVTTQINNLVNGAPGLLDTLDELAAALGDDPNFATTITTALSNRLRIDINNQGLTATQQGNGRTNLGLGSLATLSSVGNAQITDVAWSKVTGAPAFITGNQTITLSGDASGSGTTAITVTLANSGVTAGTYTKVTVDAKGRVTSGTTLSASDIPTLSYVAKSGDSMTGNLSFGSSGAGLTWAANTDGASITFESTGDGASGGRALSNLLIALTDNGDEGLKVTTTGSELLYVNVNQFQYKGNNVWHAGNLTNLNQLTNGPGYLTSESDTLATVTNRGNTTSQTLFVDQTTGGGYVFRTSSAWGGWARHAFSIADGSSNIMGAIGGYGGGGTSLSYIYIGKSYLDYSASFNPDGNIELRHDNSTKLTIDSLGISVTGRTTSGWGYFSSSTQGTPIIRANQEDTSSGFYLFQGTTGGSEMFRVDRTGAAYFANRLSVGTTYAGFALNLSGTAYVIGGHVWVNDSYGYANATSVNTGLFPDSSHNIDFKSNNSSAIYINSSRNIGINTTSPVSKLEVYSNLNASTFTGITVTNGAGANTEQARAGIAFKGYDWVQSAIWHGRNTSAGLTGALVFGTNPDTTDLTVNGVVGRMWILNNGNVGIATPSPAYRFQVQGPSGDWAIYAKGSSTANNSYGLFIDAGTSAADSPFMVRSADGTTTFLRIQGGGNIGILTASPANKLQIGSVGSSGYGGNDLAIGNGTQVMAFYQSSTVSTWYTNTNFSLMPSGSGATGNLAVGTTTASNRLTVSGSADITGNLGIGIANPAVRLDVNGSVYVRTGVLYLDTIAGYTSGVITLNSSTNLIIPSGRVGIGLTNPDAILDVSHTAGTTNIIRVSNGSGNYRWRVDQNFNMFMTTAAFVDSAGIYNNGNGFFTGSVGVGNGSSSPSNRLLVGSQSHITLSAGESASRILNWYGNTGGTEVHNDNILIAVGNSSSDTSQPRTVGLSLFNNNTTNGNYSPAITFGGLSKNGNYMNGAAAIAARLTQSGTDANFVSGDLVFYTQNTVGLTEKARLQANGNFGIGTASPSFKLQVDHSTTSQYVSSFRNTADNLQLKIGTSTGALLNIQGSTISSNAAYNICLQADGGNLGIGLSNPSTGDRVEIAGTLRVHTGNNWDAIKLYSDGANGYIQGLGDETGLRIRSEYGNVMLTDDRGAVLIGATAQEYGEKLRVNGGVTTYHTYTQSGTLVRVGTVSQLITTTAGGAGYYGGLTYTAFTGAHDNTFNGSVTIPNSVTPGGINSSTGIRFGAANVTVTLTQSGSFRAYSGVSSLIAPSATATGGSISHVAAFHALGPYYVGSNTPTITNYFGLLLNDSAEYSTWVAVTNRWGIYQHGSGDNNYFAGKVMVGTTTVPTQLMYVNGTSYFNGNMTVNGTITELSTINIKTNVETLDGALDKVEKMRGVSYNRKDNHKKEIGFIAEEVDEVYPEFVEYDEQGKPVGLHYARLTAVLLQSVKELSGRIKELEKRN